nr:N-acetylmuramoyl-L-alanine amidase-like domain-containing protein [Allomuricauda sp.]
MHRLFFILFLLFSFGSPEAQTSFSSTDSVLFQTKLKELANLKALNTGDSLVAIGKYFLGTPYVEKTLEVGKTETVVINLRGLDCTTFVENVIAFGMILKENQNDFSDFANTIKTIRYRNSILDGYSSRLHYFTDWIRNNEEKGMVVDITSEIGGEIVQKPINFMGTHRNLYPFLESDTNYSKILEIEEELAKEPLCVLPQDQIKDQEHLIHSGDIIALATSIKGLDVTHTGIAIRQNGRIHLLHASSSGEVTITQEPLVDYLKKIKSNTGVIVARPVF